MGQVTRCKVNSFEPTRLIANVHYARGKRNLLCLSASHAPLTKKGSVKTLNAITLYSRVLKSYDCTTFHRTIGMGIECTFMNSIHIYRYIKILHTYTITVITEVVIIPTTLS